LLLYDVESFVFQFAIHKHKDYNFASPIEVGTQAGLNVSENRVLRKIFGSKRDEVTEDAEDDVLRSLMVCTHRQNIIRPSRAWHVAHTGERRGGETRGKYTTWETNAFMEGYY
jgi:hypothetical protein